MMPVEKCFIHQLIDSFNEFLFEQLMGNHHYFGPCKGCTVAKQNFLERLGLLTAGSAKLPLHFPSVAGSSLGLKRPSESGRVLLDQILNSDLCTELAPPTPTPPILVGTQPLITAKTLFYSIINEIINTAGINVLTAEGSRCFSLIGLHSDQPGLWPRPLAPTNIFEK